ncbi:MAG: hypothetical protein ABI556_07145 [Gemmatimonadales bacterium]
MPKKPASVALLAAVALVLFAGSYVLGRSNFNPFSKISFKSPLSADSTVAALSLQKRCGLMAGETKSKCYESGLDSLAERGEVKLAMRTLANLAILDSDAARDGHVFAHGIGMAAGRAGGDIAKIFSQCDESNQSGCYHGVLQSYLIAKKTIGPAEVNAVCESFRGPQADRWILFQCVHGTGHGLTMYYQHDVPKALRDCDYLNGDWDRRSCYAGVFMENIVNQQMPKNMSHSHGDEHEGMDMAGMSSTPATKWKALDKNDMLYPCSIMDERYLAACYEMQTAAMLYLNGGNIQGAAKTCDTAPDRMRLVCYQSLGRDISAYAEQNHAKAIELCALGTAKYQPWCYFGLVKSFINMNARAEDGTAFCRELKGEPNKLKCYEAVGEQIGTLRNENAQRRALCESSEAEYKDACLFGARVGSRPPALEKLDVAVATSPRAD